jgi:hypothetical protein
MAAPAVAIRGDSIELTAWVSGTYLSLGIPAGGLEEGSADELDALLAAGTGREAAGVTRTRAPTAAWLLIGLGVVVLAGGVALAIALSTGTTSPATASAEDRAKAGSVNLVRGDVPEAWGQDSTATAPLAGLLGTAPASTPTAADKKAYRTVVAEYQSCMGETDAVDRVFGAAGVSPLAQIPSAPYGLVTSSSYVEAGTVTQIYATSGEVASDLTQIRSSRFPTCFGQAIGRFILTSTDPTEATAAVVITPQLLPSPLGVHVTGADTTLSLPSGSTTLPVEIGTTMLVTGRYEQTLYTFSTPNAFPADLRGRLVAVLAGRLVAPGRASGA